VYNTTCLRDIIRPESGETLGPVARYTTLLTATKKKTKKQKKKYIRHSQQRSDLFVTVTVLISRGGQTTRTTQIVVGRVDTRVRRHDGRRGQCTEFPRLIVKAYDLRDVGSTFTVAGDARFIVDVKSENLFVGRGAQTFQSRVVYRVRPRKTRARAAVL